jgi:hypothetical protein
LCGGPSKRWSVVGLGARCHFDEIDITVSLSKGPLYLGMNGLLRASNEALASSRGLYKAKFDTWSNLVKHHSFILFLVASLLLSR